MPITVRPTAITKNDIGAVLIVGLLAAADNPLYVVGH